MSVEKWNSGKYSSSSKEGAMITQKSLILMVIGTLLSLFMSGCAGYGKIAPESVSGEKMTVAALVSNWQDYNVYAAPMDAALVFAPKGDKNTLEFANQWIKVTDKEFLVSSARNIEAQPSTIMFRPTLWRIIGPNGDFYGYIFTAWDQQGVVLREVNKNTLFVYNILQPPYLEEAPGRVRRPD
jgi:hypothetical protein